MKISRHAINDLANRIQQDEGIGKMLSSDEEYLTLTPEERIQVLERLMDINTHNIYEIR